MEFGRLVSLIDEIVSSVPFDARWCNMLHTLFHGPVLFIGKLTQLCNLNLCKCAAELCNEFEPRHYANMLAVYGFRKTFSSYSLSKCDPLRVFRAPVNSINNFNYVICFSVHTNLLKKIIITIIIINNSISFKLRYTLHDTNWIKHKNDLIILRDSLINEKKWSRRGQRRSRTEANVTRILVINVTKRNLK